MAYCIFLPNKKLFKTYYFYILESHTCQTPCIHGLH